MGRAGVSVYMGRANERGYFSHKEFCPVGESDTHDGVPVFHYVGNMAGE